MLWLGNAILIAFDDKNYGTMNGAPQQKINSSNVARQKNKPSK